MLNVFFECVVILYYFFLFNIEILKSGLADWALCTCASVWDAYLVVGLIRSLFKKRWLLNDPCQSQYFRGSLQSPSPVIYVLMLIFLYQIARGPLITKVTFIFFAFLDLNLSSFVCDASNSWFFSVLWGHISFLLFSLPSRPPSFPSFLLCFIQQVIWGTL